MSHVVLLGDSIFDNARYVPGGPSVIEHLRRCLPGGWRATLLARDGAGTVELARQLDQVPRDATHLVVSVGGNDALDHSGLLLHEPAGAFAEVLTRLADIRAQFQRDYRAALGRVLGLGKPTAVCTAYDAIPGLSDVEATGLCLFNDVILREAFRAGPGCRCWTCGWSAPTPPTTPVPRPSSRPSWAGEGRPGGQPTGDGVRFQG
jgi:hypothetical protein